MAETRSTDEIVISANATEALAAYRALHQALLAEETAIRKTAEQQRQAAREQRQAAAEAAREQRQAAAEAARAAREQQQLDQEAQRIREANFSAQEKFNRAIARATELKNAGRLTEAEFNREIERQQRLLQESQDQAGGLANRITQFGKDAFVAFTGVGSAIAGVMAVARILKAEYEQMLRRQDEARARQLTFGEAVRQLAVEMRPDESLRPADLEATVRGVSLRTGASLETVAQTLAPALLNREELSNRAAVEVVEQALRVLPADAAASQSFSQAALELMKQQPGLSPAAALGLVMQIREAGTLEHGELASAAIPSMFAAMRRGEDVETSAELFATMRRLLGPLEASKSRQSVEALVEALHGFAPSPIGQDERGMFRVDRAAIEEFRRAQTTSQRIAALRRHPDLRRQFLGQESFRTVVSPAIESLLSGDAEALAIERDVREAIQAPGAGTFEEFLRRLELPSQRIPRAERAAEASVAAHEIRAQYDAARAEARKIYEQALDKVDLPGPDSINRFLFRQSFDLLSETPIEDQMRSLRALTEPRRGRGGRIEPPSVIGEEAALLREMADRMRELVEIEREARRQVSSQERPEQRLGVR